MLNTPPMKTKCKSPESLDNTMGVLAAQSSLLHHKIQRRMMRALQYKLESDTFAVEEIAIPVPGNDEIRVKCLATALNPVDAKIAMWKGALIDMDQIVLGLDVCGVVDAIGSDVVSLKVGDKVLYHGRMKKGNGGFAEYSIHDALTTVLINDKSFDPVTLAASPCAAWTAHRALYDKLNVPKVVTDTDLSIVIVGASGGVGTFALQFAKMSGFTKIIAVCSKKNGEYVRSLGATDVIDYHSEPSLCDAIQRAVSNEGVDYVLDCVGEVTARDAVRALRFDGKICPVVSYAEGDMQVQYTVAQFTAATY